MDHLPESPTRVLPARASCLLQQLEGRLYTTRSGLAGNHVLRHLPRPVVSERLQISSDKCELIAACDICGPGKSSHHFAYVSEVWLFILIVGQLSDTMALITYFM